MLRRSGRWERFLREYLSPPAPLPLPVSGPAPLPVSASISCKLLGPWGIAAELIHEMTHNTLTPAKGQEGRAEQMVLDCGFTHPENYGGK